LAGPAAKGVQFGLPANFGKFLNFRISRQILKNFVCDLSVILKGSVRISRQIWKIFKFSAKA
jgi:hypothetical protein